MQRKSKIGGVSEKINLKDKMASLPGELVDFLRAAGELARQRGQKLYLVGGVVRDLLLGRPNLDLDLVVEGDAISLAHAVGEKKAGKVTKHARFGTAMVQWGSWRVDVATARRETYARPGALPEVTPGTITDDLLRRDLSINAMALDLSPEQYGTLLDPYGGMADLQQKLVRILHQRSFIDDATRIWRALRYEQRLDFQIEAGTLEYLRRDISMLDSISGDRIRHELEAVFREELPEKVLRRADELGVLAKLHPSLRGNDWLAVRFARARRLTTAESPAAGLYLALLAYRLEAKDTKQLTDFLKLRKSLLQTLQDTISLKNRLKALEEPGLKASRVYAVLSDYQVAAMNANLAATDSPTVARHVMRYLKTLRHVKPLVTGDDLERLGIAPGPTLKDILNKLRDARLDGEVKTKEDEEKMVKGKITLGVQSHDAG